MIGYMDRTAGAVEHCESMASAAAAVNNGPVQEAYETLSDYCKRKLWHQLTMQVLKMLEQPSMYGGVVSGGSSNNSNSNNNNNNNNNNSCEAYLALYDKVVLCVDSKLNPLSLARIAALVAQAITPTDATAAKAILENLLAKKKQQVQESTTMSSSSSSSSSTLSGRPNLMATGDALLLRIPSLIFVESKLASLILTTTHAEAPPEDFHSILAQFKTNKDLLREYPAEGNSQLAVVHAAYYEATMHYYKRVGPPEAFYDQALNYLQHMGPDFGKIGATATATATATPAGCLYPPHQLAVDLILAALTGDGVYNLGQVEQTPVLKLLVDTHHPDAWLVHLLQATAAGNVAQFRNYHDRYAAQIAATPALMNRANAVTEKLSLLALVTLVFSKPPHERQLSFDEIATALMLDSIDGINQVEWIVMRALSVHLIDGFIDQVAQTVTITWVMPRVLTNAQLQQLATRFGQWAHTVSATQDSMTAAIA